MELEAVVVVILIEIVIALLVAVEAAATVVVTTVQAVGAAMPLLTALITPRIALNPVSSPRLFCSSRS